MTEGQGPLSFGDDEEREDSGRGERAERDATPESPAAREPFRLDEPEEEAPAGPPVSARPPGAFRYGWVVGVAFLIVVALVTVNTLRTGSGGSAGLKAGTPLPPFAMPLALSSLDGDADVARQANSGKAGKHPACSLRGPRILNVCQLAEEGPVVLAFFAARAGGACGRELDRLERARPSHPRIRFAAVAIRGNRGDLRKEIRKRGWHFPVGYDRDGVVANLYGISVCPTITFATEGGIVVRTTVGELNDKGLAAELRVLERSP
jgi:peroxiredoxin